MLFHAVIWLFSFHMFFFQIPDCRFEQYVDYALDVPMYFVYRKHKYIDCTGMTFRVPIYLWFSCNLRLSHVALPLFIVKVNFFDPVFVILICSVLRNDYFSSQDFLAGKLPCIPGELPTLNDWENHLTTIFPEVCFYGFHILTGFCCFCNGFEAFLWLCSYKTLLFSGQIEEVFGDERCWWRALEKVMCFTGILGEWTFTTCTWYS